MRVYIAGPYTKGDVARNVAKAMEAANELMDAGHAPYIPHLTHFMHIHLPRPYEDWLKLDLTYLTICEAIIRLVGESSGADREVSLARSLRLPVFATVEEFIRCAPELRRLTDTSLK